MTDPKKRKSEDDNESKTSEESNTRQDGSLMSYWYMGECILDGNMPVFQVKGGCNDLMHCLLLGLPRLLFDGTKTQLDLRKELKLEGRKTEVLVKARNLAGPFWAGDIDWNSEVDAIFDEGENYYRKDEEYEPLEVETVLTVFAIRFKMRVVLYIEHRRTDDKGKVIEKQEPTWSTKVYDGRSGVADGLQKSQVSYRKCFVLDWRETVGLVLTKNHYDLFNYAAWQRNKQGILDRMETDGDWVW
jgi:hypothetical protein